MPSLNVASSCRSSARHAFHAFLFWRSFEYATFVRSRSRRRRSFSMAWSSISCNEVLVSSAICARLRCAVRLMRIVDGIQICIRSRIRNCQRNQNGSSWIRLREPTPHRAGGYDIIYEIASSAEGANSHQSPPQDGFAVANLGQRPRVMKI